MVQRRVAVEDLDEQPVDEDSGGQAAGPPAVSHLASDLLDEGPVEVQVEVLPDRAEGGIKGSLHREGLRQHGCVITP